MERPLSINGEDPIDQNTAGRMAERQEQLNFPRQNESRLPNEQHPRDGNPDNAMYIKHIHCA
jgi:hypothetical protein